MTCVRVDGKLGCGVGFGLFRVGSGPVGENGMVGPGSIGPTGTEGVDGLILAKTWGRFSAC